MKKNELGLRYNEGKIPLDLIDPYAMRELAKVLQFGANKYAPHNWRKGLKISECIASLKRHVNLFEDGFASDVDEETQLHHIAHAMCNCMFILWILKHLPDLDDRWKPLVSREASKNRIKRAEKHGGRKTNTKRK